MHSLFWKIFLSFWGALILFATATMIAASSFIEQMRSQQGNPNPRARLMSYAVEARSVAEADGPAALQSWLQDLDRREAIPILIFDADDVELLGRPVPALIADKLARARQEQRQFGSMPLIRLVDGSQYRLAADYEGVTLGRVLRRPRVLALPLIITAIVSGLVCFFLARYLTTPLHRLRVATDQVAAGDLDYRVAPRLGRRRDEIAELAVAFDQMAGRLQSLMSSHKQLLRDVSHELRSPLSRLQVAVGLMRQRLRGSPEAELDRIELEAERLNELIGQLLSLTRLESGNEVLSPQAVDVADLLESVAEDAAFEARTRNRDVDIVSTAPAVVRGDARLLHRALDNVIRNAVKYTAEHTRIEISMERHNQPRGDLVIKVRDHGPGVPENMLPRLFEPFVRVDDARDRASGGFGLGLAIAERSIRAQGGYMSARNEPDGGFSIAIHVPV